MEYKDYYKILGLDKKATQEEIKKAYRKLARQYHPDKNPGNKDAEEKFKQVNEANEVLGNPENRKKYDELGSNWNKFNQTGQPGGGFDWSAYGGERGRTYRQEGNFEDLFGGGGFSDFFETFFGGRKGRKQSFKGHHYETEMELTLEEAYHGASRIIQVHQEKLRITTKPGAYDGQVLRIKGKGAPGSNGENRGDLYVRVKVQPHMLFERRDDDLYANVNIDLYTAVLGGNSLVQTLSGNIKVTIPPGTGDGNIIRIKGKGMPVYSRPGTYGNLYLRMKVLFPTNLSAEEKRLFEQLRQLQQEKKVKQN